ncbi:MAG: WD40 repeat domain-containing protein [Epulopiscium sp.]|nr:WD40 repeat domain-containing protein [Candidatus Epulonipiscium sp.]
MLVQFERSVYLWNIDTEQECGNIGITRSFITGINNIAVSNDGKYLGVVALDKTITASNATFVRIFDIQEGIKIYESKHGYVNNPAENICFSPDNSYAVISLRDPSGRLVVNILRKPVLFSVTHPTLFMLIFQRRMEATANFKQTCA